MLSVREPPTRASMIVLEEEVLVQKRFAPSVVKLTAAPFSTISGFAAFIVTVPFRIFRSYPFTAASMQRKVSFVVTVWPPRSSVRLPPEASAGSRIIAAIGFVSEAVV